MARLEIQNYPAAVIHLVPYTSSQSLVTLDAATPTLDFVSFIAPKNPFSGGMGFFEFRKYFGTATGSPKVTAYIYSDNNGVPGSVVDNGTGVESGIISSNSWVSLTWTGTLPSLTEGLQYHVVSKCTAGTSVAATTQYNTTSNLVGAIGSTGVGSGQGWRSNYGSGLDTVWAGTGRAQASGFRFGITDGTDTAYWGYPIQAGATAINGTGWRIDGTQKVGVVFTTPGNGRIRIKSMIVPVRKNSAPGNLSLKIYQGTGTSPTATGNAIPAGNLATASGIFYIFDLSTPLELAPSTVYRSVLDAASGSNGTNYYYLQGGTMDTDATSLAIMPWGLQTCMLSGSSWTDSTTYAVPFGLVLDGLQPFGSVSGGGAFVIGS